MIPRGVGHNRRNALCTKMKKSNVVEYSTSEGV